MIQTIHITYNDLLFLANYNLKTKVAMHIFAKWKYQHSSVFQVSISSCKNTMLYFMSTLGTKEDNYGFA